MMPAHDNATHAAILGSMALYAAAAFLPLFPATVPLPWIVAGSFSDDVMQQPEFALDKSEELP
jgi:hypothetical protein